MGNKPDTQGAESESGLVATLSLADSVTSLLVHRYPDKLDDDLAADLKLASLRCRSAAKALADRDSIASQVAEAVWPGRYLGDLSRADWDRCYAAIDVLLVVGDD